jgi:hypothetical protein
MKSSMVQVTVSPAEFTAKSLDDHPAAEVVWHDTSLIRHIFVGCPTIV